MSWKSNNNNSKSNSDHLMQLSAPRNQSSSNCCLGVAVHIRDIRLDLQNIRIRGLVVSKRPIKLFRTNYENNVIAEMKGVFSFTVRDSVHDCVNVTSWGKCEQSKRQFASFGIGDVLVITNPIIEKKTGKYDDYSVQTNCAFNLSINDKQSSIELYYGGDRNNYLALQNTLLHSMSDHVTLFNMIRYMESAPKDVQIKGQHFTFLAIIKDIGIPQDLLSKTVKDENNQNKILHKLDLSLMDESCKTFPITIWDLDWIEFARINWIPGVTVLSLVDCKVKYDEYKRGIIGIIDGRTVAVLNPDIMESHKLRHLVNLQKAMNSEIGTNDQKGLMNESLNFMAEVSDSEIPLSSIQNVLSVKSVLLRSVDMEYGIIYGILSSFNIDCDDPFKHFIFLKCKNCKRRIIINQLYCTTLDCPMIGQKVSWSNKNSVEVEFSTVISITDHTGTLTKCSLSGKPMEDFLNLNPYQMIETDRRTRSQMKWNMFLNRYKFYVKNALPSFDNSNPYTKILGIRVATVFEILASVKE